MNKKNFAFFLVFVFFTYSINPSKAINIGDTIKKGIEKNIELAIKGKKLNDFFSGNKLTLSFEGKKKEYRFQAKKYEVFEDGNLTETGKWKVSGIFKNQIRLKPENKKKSYYFKKIAKKAIIYHFDTLPSDEKAKKTLVEIEKSSKFTDISNTTESTSSTNTSSNESKDTKVEEPKVEETEEPKATKKKKKKKKSSKSLNIGETLNKGISKVLGGKSTESRSNENKIQKHLLEKYRATSNVSYYFFEASINYLQSLELLYRAYDNNVEADKISSSIDYLKNSKSTESDRLKSTQSIIGTSSIKIQSSIQDASYVLSEKGRGYYEQSLPFALGAAESTISLYASSKNALQTIAQSGGFNIDSLLYNAKDLAAIITILPEIPGFSKDMIQTVKLIFSGAREKKIRDEGKYSKALAELNLSEMN